jgi:hypothetical protein
MENRKELLREILKLGTSERQFAGSDTSKALLSKTSLRKFKLLTRQCGEFSKLYNIGMSDMDLVKVSVMEGYVEALNFANIFRKRKYSQPVVLQKVKVKSINSKFALIFTRGLQDEIKELVSSFADSCKKMPGRIEEYRTFDYVRCNNSLIYGIISPEALFVNRKCVEVFNTEALLKDTVDIAGDLILDLSCSNQTKVIFLVRAIRESL